MGILKLCYGLFGVEGGFLELSMNRIRKTKPFLVDEG